MIWPFSKKKDVEIVVNHDVDQQLAVNAADNAANTLRETMSSISGGYHNADTMHNVYCDFGYPEELMFQNFWDMYRRSGIARNGCDLPVDISWVSPPTVNASGAFESMLNRLIEEKKLWRRTAALDRRQRVGRYAGMFVRVRDSKAPSEALTEKLNIGHIVQLIPLYEGQLEVLSIEDDVKNDNYSLPTMYQYHGAGHGNRNEKTATSFSIHPSRIIIAAEGADDGGIHGIPAMESGYNSLMDLIKIIGSGGEGFYKNAAQNIAFELSDPKFASSVNSKQLKDFNDNWDDFMRNRSRRASWTPGMKPVPLSTTLVQPQEFFNNALNDAAANFKVPATILIGMQTGRLASSEDSRSFLSTVNSRRANYLTEMVSSVLDWFIGNGVLPSESYEIEFDDLLEMSDAEKLDSAIKMGNVNREQFNSGQMPAFSSEEIREQAGYDPTVEIDELEGELDGIEDEDIDEEVEEIEGDDE